MLPVTNSYKNHLHRQLDEICEALRRTTTLSLILDYEWCDRIRLDIENYKEDSVFSSTLSLIFFQLKHPFRGVPWFEKAQSTILSGPVNQLENDEKFAIASIGLDPLKVYLPEWDERLAALSKPPLKDLDDLADFIKEAQRVNSTSLNGKVNLMTIHQVITPFPLRGVGSILSPSCWPYGLAPGS